METQKTTGRIGLIGMVLGLSVLCLLAPPEYALAAGTTYYVSLSGNDTNNGNALDTAWRTIDHAVDHVSAGDTIYVVPGNYGAEHVTITTSGTASNPITITRYDTSGMITLKHDVGGEGNGIRVDGNYWIIEYFDVSDYHVCIWINRDHNIVNLSNASGKTRFGFYLSKDTGNHNTLNDCVAHHIDLQLPETLGSGYSVKGSFNLLKNCSAYSCRHFGISLRSYSVSSVIDGGEYYDMNNDTAIAGGGTDCTIKNAYVHDSSNGIRQYADCRNLTIDNCTIRNMATHGGIQIYGNGAIVSNNIISDWQKKQAVWSEGANVIYSGNDMQGSLPEYRFHKRYSGCCKNSVIRDQKADRFEIVTTKGVGLPTIEIEYTNGRVFKEKSGTYTSHHYPEKSSLTLVGVNWVHWFITAYNMTATPASGSATATVSRFDTSLPQGEILVDFTADTTDTNSVTFAVSGVIPNEDYEVKRDGAAFATLTASDEGSIQFVNSEWPSARTFTIKQITVNTGKLTGTATDATNGKPIVGATITAGSFSPTTDDSGDYAVMGLLPDTYTVTASADGYLSVSDSAIITAGNTTILDFQLEAGAPRTGSGAGPQKLEH